MQVAPRMRRRWRRALTRQDVTPRIWGRRGHAAGSAIGIAPSPSGHPPRSPPGESVPCEPCEANRCLGAEAGVVRQTWTHLHGQAQEILHLTRPQLGEGYSFRQPAGVRPRLGVGRGS